MRLVCPNCGAQYEVPDDVIPQTGRDVQCSNCGHTWFQVHPEQDAGLAEDLDQPALEDDGFGPDDTEEDASEETGHADDDVEADAGATEDLTEPGAPDDWVTADDTLDEVPENAEDLWSDDEAPEAWDEDEMTSAAAQMPTPPLEDYEDDYEAWDESPPPAPETRRKLDPDVADLLREEAEREARQRAAERDPLESQPDLGLTQSDEDETARRQREAQERMARLRGTPVPENNPSGMDQDDDEAAAAAAAAAAASRRDLLPDIDEINSTLRSTSDRRPAAADDHEHPGQTDTAPRAASTSSGFSRGFMFVVLIMVLAIMLYVFAPRLAESVPALKAPLAAYVDMMNGLRLWIDGWLRGLLGWLDGMSGDS